MPARAAPLYVKGVEGGEEEPEDHALGYSRGGFGTKLHLLTDSNGIPLHVELSAGQRHESRLFELRVRAPSSRATSSYAEDAGLSVSHPTARAAGDEGSTRSNRPWSTLLVGGMK